MAVMCECCHTEIEACGWVGALSEGYYCDECADAIGEPLQEMRICDRCGSVMTQGFCNEFGYHVCEGCWDGYVAETYPNGFRETPEDEYEEEDDYYQAFDAESGEWYVTSWYWTEWE